MIHDPDMAAIETVLVHRVASSRDALNARDNHGDLDLSSVFIGSRASKLLAVDSHRPTLPFHLSCGL